MDMQWSRGRLAILRQMIECAYNAADSELRRVSCEYQDSHHTDPEWCEMTRLMTEIVANLIVASNGIARVSDALWRQIEKDTRANQHTLGDTAIKALRAEEALDRHVGMCSECAGQRLPHCKPGNDLLLEFLRLRGIALGEPIT